MDTTSIPGHHEVINDGINLQNLVPYKLLPLFPKRDIVIDESASQEQQLSQWLSSFTIDEVTNILWQCPLRSLLLFRSVSTQWNSLIASSQFVASYVERRAPIVFLVRTKDINRVSRRLQIMEFEHDMFLNHEPIHLTPAFKLPLRDSKAFLKENQNQRVERPRRSAVNSVLKTNSQKLDIACNPRNDKFELVNICNGLLCISGPLQKHICIVICNPITGEFLKLPEFPPHTRNMLNTPRLHTYIYVGFGMNPKTKEHKVLKVLTRYTLGGNGIFGFNSITAVVQVIGTSTWTHVLVDHELSQIIVDLKFVTYVAGRLHWIAQHSLLCFDLETDSFHTFPSPPLPQQDFQHCTMGEVRGTLYLCNASLFNNITMWAANGGVGDPWTRLYTVNVTASHLGAPQLPFGFCWPLRNEGIELMVYHSVDRFLCFNPAYGFRVFRIHGTQSPLLEVIRYTPNFTPLKNLVNEADVQTVHSRCSKYKLREERETLTVVQENVVD